MKIKYILIVLHFLISLFSFSQTEKDILKVDGGKIIFEDNKAIIEINRYIVTEIPSIETIFFIF